MDELNRPATVPEQLKPAEEVTPELTPPANPPRRLKLFIIGGSIVFLAIILFAPFPIYQKEFIPGGPCTMSWPVSNCPTTGRGRWVFGPSLWERFLVRQKPFPSTSPREPLPTPNPTADLSRDEVLRDWKTYKNASLGYELKYPTSLRLIEVANLGLTILTDMELDEPAIYPAEENVLVEPVGDQTGSTPAIYKGFYFKIQNGPRLGRYTALHLWKKINVNGLNVYKTEDSFKSGGHEGKYISIVWEDSRGNQYEANASFNASKKDYLTLFNQILSTFKFLNQVTPTPSSYEVCIQVITPARNPQTGECREFPTPCDVPQGWVAAESCNR